MRKALLAALATGLIVASGAAVAETTLRFSNWVPPTHPVTTDILMAWGKNVEAATSGRVKVEFISPLAKPPAHFDLVKNGVADLAMAVHSYTAARFTLTVAAELPFISEDSTSASVAYWRLHRKFFQAANEHDGVKLIGLWVHGPAHAFTLSTPITSLADLNGLKIRVAGGITKDIAVALGAVPYFAPAPKTYEALSKGVADGIFFPAESVPGFNLQTIIRHALLVPGGLYRSSQYLIMNQAKWDALPAEDKAAIDSVSGEALARLAGNVWDTQDAKGMQTMTKAGVAFRTADGALLDEIRARIGPLERDWLKAAEAKGIDGRAALAFYRAEIAALKKTQ